MNSSLVEIRSIINKLEQAFKCISKQHYSPHLYLVLSITIPTAYAIPIILWKNEIALSIAILLGFCGSTSIVVLLGSLIILIDEHIDCSKRYYESLAKSILITSEKDASTRFKRVYEEYSSMGIIELKYLPVLLIAAYTSLLLIEETLISLSLMMLFSAVCGLTYHKVFKLFIEHVNHETDLQRLFVEIYGARDSEFKAFEKPPLSKTYAPIILSALTLTVGLVAYSIVKHGQVFNNHISTHRLNHSLTKDIVAKALGLIK